MCSEKLPGFNSDPQDSELAEKINSFWSIIQNKHADDPVSVLHEAASIWNRPIFAKLPDTDGPFYSHHSCSLEACRQVMSFLDEYYRLSPVNSSSIIVHLDGLPLEIQTLYPGGILSCQFVHGNICTGYIAFGGCTPFTSLDHMFLLNLRGVLAVLFTSDQYVEINRGISNALLFRAMLEGKSADMDLSPVQHFIDKLPKGNVWKCHIMLVDCNTDSRNRLQFLRETYASMVTCSLRTIYDGRVALLYHGRSKYPIQEHHVFTEYLRSNGLKCAISRNFTNLYEVPKYYAQAIAALELGPKFSPDKVLFSYEDYAPFHVIQLAARSVGIDELQSPRLLELKSYDGAKGTELVKTLRVYLCNLKDVTAVATALNIHRNTLFHRLRKIEEITGWDLNDGKTLNDIIFFLRVLDVTDYI